MFQKTFPLLQNDCPTSIHCKLDEYGQIYAALLAKLYDVVVVFILQFIQLHLPEIQNIFVLLKTL